MYVKHFLTVIYPNCSMPYLAKLGLIIIFNCVCKFYKDYYKTTLRSSCLPGYPFGLA